MIVINDIATRKWLKINKPLENRSRRISVEIPRLKRCLLSKIMFITDMACTRNLLICVRRTRILWQVHYK